MPVLEAPITAVTVFTHRARIIRQGKIALEPGEHTLIIDNLPASLEEDSVRMSGTGAGVTLLGVDVKREVVNTLENTARALTQRVEALTRDRKVQEDKRETLAARMTMLKTVAEHTTIRFGTMLAAGKSGTEKVTEMSDYIEQERDTLQARQREVDDRIRALNAEIELLIQQGKEYKTEQFRPVIQFHITLRAATAVNFTLEASYLVNQAWWTPLYDVRLRDNNEVELSYLATITQRTGEDWNHVRMALSTARPAISVTLPKLRAWYLNDARVPPKAAPSRTRGIVDGLFQNMPQDADERNVEDDVFEDEAFGGEVPAEEIAVSVETAQVAASGASVTYSVGTPVTIPSDGSPHKTGVAITRLSAKLDYLSVPKIALEAYLRATITNTSEYTLLPGQVSIFHGDEFVGKTIIQTIAPGEEFEVSLGVDERIKIERELVNREVSRRFIGSNRRIVYAYKITVTNLLPEAATVTISDGIPVSQHESIKIQREKIVPAPTEQTELNVLSWTLELAAGATQDILLSFTVEHPRDMVISGLVE